MTQTLNWDEVISLKPQRLVEWHMLKRAPRHEWPPGARVHDLPARPGVYVVWQSNDDPLYLGETKSLRKRLPSHGSISGNLAANVACYVLGIIERPTDLRYQRLTIEDQNRVYDVLYPCTFSYVECPSPEIAQASEATMLLHGRPIANGPRKSERHASI